MRCIILHNNHSQEENTATLRYSVHDQQNKIQRWLLLPSKNNWTIKRSCWPFITQKGEYWTKREPVISSLAGKYGINLPASIQTTFSFSMATGCFGSSDLLDILSSGLLNTLTNICWTKDVKHFLYPCQCVWLPLVCFSIVFAAVFHHNYFF